MLRPNLLEKIRTGMNLHTGSMEAGVTGGDGVGWLSEKAQVCE